MNVDEPLPSDAILDVARQNIRLAVALRETNFSRVAEAAGLSRNAVSQFVSGHTSLSYVNMVSVCDALNIPIGLVHVPNSITPGKIRVHRALVNLPDHLAERALEVIRSELSR